MNVLAIIPARGGSKGVPGKNIYPINGVPLIRYSVDVAVESKCFYTVVVTSDDDQILKASDVPGVMLLKRPADLAQDKSSIIPVINHTLEWLSKRGVPSPDAIMLLQPTSPMREVFHIQDAIRKLRENHGVNSVIGVCQMTDVHPARMYTIQDDQLLSLMPELEQVRRQDIKPVYYRNGSIYLVRTAAFLTDSSVMVKPSTPLVMSDNYLANIDEPRDLVVAEALIKVWQANKK